MSYESICGRMNIVIIGPSLLATKRISDAWILKGERQLLLQGEKPSGGEMLEKTFEVLDSIEAADVINLPENVNSLITNDSLEPEERWT